MTSHSKKQKDVNVSKYPITTVTILNVFSIIERLPYIRLSQQGRIKDIGVLKKI